jgi:hypothetical protein
MADEQLKKELFFAFLLHEAENLHNRVDWFLIFHGILFEAFFAAHYNAQRITIGALGCLVAYVWLVAGIRQLWDIGHMVKSASDEGIMGREVGELFRRLFEARQLYQPRWMKWARATPAFCIVLPLAVSVAWLVVTSTAIELGINFPGLIAAVATLLVFTRLWIKVQPGPKILPDAIGHLRGGSTAREGTK